MDLGGDETKILDLSGGRKFKYGQAYTKNLEDRHLIGKRLKHRTTFPSAFRLNVYICVYAVGATQFWIFSK